MASQSPQRARRPTAHPATHGSMHNIRETSRSPSLQERPRAVKGQSAPILPSAMQTMQMFSHSNGSQSSLHNQQQPSPTMNPRRSPPPGVPVRMLPTPPIPAPPNPQDIAPERRMSPTPQYTSHPPNPIHPRPINRGPPPQFLSKYQGIEQDNVYMAPDLTPELLANIQAEIESQYPPGYSQAAPDSPPKDPAVERVRATERSSPKEVMDNSQQQRRPQQQQAPRESPKVRDRPQPTSPTAPSFPQASGQTPEHRSSPQYQSPHSSPSEHPSAGYNQYSRESPPVNRRPANAASQEPPRQPISLANQTPPLQAIATRTPDKSLPVQEEPEDEPGAKNGSPSARHSWQNGDEIRVEKRGGSPTPSSDLNPDKAYDGSINHSARGRPNDQADQAPRRYAEQETAEDEENFTPRSPTAELPDHPPPQLEKYYLQQAGNARTAQTIRARNRNGSTDQLGMRSFDPSLFEHDQTVLPMGSEHPHYIEEVNATLQRQQPQHLQATQHQQNQVNDRVHERQHLAPQRQVQQPQQQQPPQQEYPDQQIQQPAQQYQLQDSRLRDARQSYNKEMINQQYHATQMQREDSQAYEGESPTAYIQSYFQSSRPDAPIPPTPHSQTAAPSPSPLLSATYDDLNVNSPLPVSGSPYPFPFNHVRRNFIQQSTRAPYGSSNYDPNSPAMIHEQYTRQWQMYAQNQRGNVTDSTFSPAATPFPGAAYVPWAQHHTNRILGRSLTTMSMQSSPSHEPVALPPPPPMIGVKKRTKQATLRRSISNRKPPPRVESTQPRETSPEPVSSGEETAGEERYVVPDEAVWVNGTVPVIVTDEDDGEWIEEEPDAEDLLELEYHPNFVSNIEKRRRKWEIGWEALTQAFQNLDRQTDATMMILAAPSHSTKLYYMRSRSIRQPAPTNDAFSKEVRSAFGRIASHRRRARLQKSSLYDRFLSPNASAGGDGSDGSSESREEDLRRMLEASMKSLGALREMYELREARWKEEMHRIKEDKEKVDLLVRQVLGGVGNTADTGET